MAPRFKCCRKEYWKEKANLTWTSNVTKRKKLFDVDYIDDNGEIEPYPIDDVIDTVCEWKYERILDADAHRNDPKDFKDYSEFQDKYDSWKAMDKDWYQKNWTLDIQNMSWVEDTGRQVDFLINQTIAHNMMTMSQYPMTKDMLEKSVHPIPSELWDYGCTKYGAPRPIVNLDQFEYSIRKEVRARITRKGIEWNGLYYIANDPWLAEQITKTRRSSVPLKCRLDERNVGSLWYIADNRLVKATLNENRAGNYEFNGMSLRNYEEYKTKKKELVMEKAQEDQEIRCARRMGMQATLDDAVRVANQTAPNDDKTKNIRRNRKEESILVLEANSIGARLNTDDAPSLIPLKNEEPEPEALSEPESNEETGSMTFEEALQKIKQKM